MARSKIANSNGMLTGDGMALAGIIIGGVAAALGIGLFVLWVIVDTGTTYRY